PGSSAPASSRAVGPGQRVRPAHARDPGAAAAANRRRSDAGPGLHGDDPGTAGADAAPRFFVAVRSAARTWPPRTHPPRLARTSEGPADRRGTGGNVRRDLALAANEVGPACRGGTCTPRSRSASGTYVNQPFSLQLSPCFATIRVRRDARFRVRRGKRTR